MKDPSDADKDPGGPVPLAHKSLSDVTGVGLGTHLRGSSLGASQVVDHPGYFRGPLGMSGANLPHPFHLPGLGPAVYPPSLIGSNFNPAAFLASLATRSEPVGRGRSPLPPPLISSHVRNPALANIAYDILKDSRRHQELLFAISKLSATPPVSSAPPGSTSSTPSPSTSSSFPLTSLHNAPSPPPKQTQEASPPETQALRAASLSPSSYMTPRSLNGSPSASTPNLGSMMLPTGSMSPTSPMAGGGDSGPTGSLSSSGATPQRKPPPPRGERAFSCQVCGRSFGYKHVLQNHERTHTGEKPFECRECHKRFTRDHHLKTHMRLHTGEKPYHCTHCDRQFVQVANLRRHLRVHTGERPYSCDICSSRFSDSNQLKAHLLIHRGEKPFECSRCHAKFRRRHHLIHHKCPRDPEGGEDSSRDPPPAGWNACSDLMAFDYVETIFMQQQEMDEDDSLRVSAPSPGAPPVPTTVLMDEDSLQHSEKRRERKSKEPRRLLVSSTPPGMSSPPPKDTILSPQLPPTPLPEQTEPEDLSINGARRSAHHKHTYRANIALTTSGYPRYPLQYPSPIEGHRSIDEGQVLVDGYDANGGERISANL